VYRAALQDCTAHRRPSAWYHGVLLYEVTVLGRHVVGRGQSLQLAVLSVDAATYGPTQPRRVLDQRLEYGPKIEGRSADQLQHLGGRRLLFQRLRDLSMCGRERFVLLFQFLEQPHVLDGNDGLVPEGLEQRDLLVGKGTRLRLVGVERAAVGAIAQHWGGQNAPEV